MSVRVHSGIIFDLLCELTNRRVKKDVYRMLLIPDADNNTGTRFANGIDGRCWWPELHAWYGKCDKDQNELWCDEDYQKAQDVVTAGQKYPDAAFPLECTFPSWVYHVLMEQAGRDFDSAKQMAVSVCARNGVVKPVIRTYQNASFPEIADSLIQLSMQARNQPLSIEDDDKNIICLAYIQALLEGKLGYELSRSAFALGMPLEPSVHLRIVQPFDSQDAFLRAILPEAMLPEERSSLMTFGYTEADKDKYSRLMLSDSRSRTRMLAHKCSVLCASAINVNALYPNALFLIGLSEENDACSLYLRHCFQSCVNSTNPSKGLAVIILYALLGPEYFKLVIPHESDCPLALAE